MCGIWASIGFDVDPERLARIAHRGPDGEGWRTFASPHGPVALGHRRLTIIDTSAGGHQPRTDTTGRYWLTFNGEIYNYIELRDELRALGCVFQTQSDSEVLLHALITWGEAALPRLDGMFAFAFWDDKSKSLLLARDRFGIKPLYVTRVGTNIAFGSEIKQLYDLPGVSRAMNLARVRDFLATGISDHTRETMFEGVQQLRGGEVARIDLNRWAKRTPFTPRQWYTLPKPGSLKLSLADAADRYRTLFEGAIAQHLRSDVPVGSCLSGGLDSSSIGPAWPIQPHHDHQRGV
jgi:asparagine synthase (glutamine-hydrolysing)